MLFEKMSAYFNRLLIKDPNRAPVMFYAFDFGINAGILKMPRPLDMAIRERDRKKIRSLLEAGANPNLVTRYSGPALNEAVDANDMDTIKLLIKYQADINKGNSEGMTPLHRAVSFPVHDNLQNHAVIKYLLMMAADADAKDVYGNTPRSLARHFNYAEAEKLIQTHHVNEPRVKHAAPAPQT